MAQYREVKAAYPGALLLFRVGDFYETFGEDAVKTARILDITLTKRSNGSASEIELAGFPHHALDTYLPKLTRAGERVAICDQLEEPQKGKGIVRRGVTELVTPGVSANDKTYDARKNNFLATIAEIGQQLGTALIDITTGEFWVAQGSVDYIERLIRSIQPSEIVFAKNYREKFHQIFGEDFYSYSIDPWFFDVEFGMNKITKQLKVESLRGFGIADWDVAIMAAGAALHYINQTHHNDLSHINAIRRIDENENVWLDSFTIRNLELLTSNHPNGSSLLDILDKTLSPMGSRMLKKWMVLPLRDIHTINQRLDLVATLKEDDSLKNTVQKHIKAIGDLERLISKVALKRINPRELVSLGNALKHIAELKSTLKNSNSIPLQNLSDTLHNLTDTQFLIETHIHQEPPVVLSKGGIFKDGIHEDLDKYNYISRNSKEILVNIRQSEMESTGISSLKLSFNNVFGYYLEVTHTHKDKVPEHWIRKQTLVNAERYITPELKEFEEKILSAEEKIKEIELILYMELLGKIATIIPSVQQNAASIAALDCIQSFAEVSFVNNYTRPEVNNGLSLVLKDARHPVIEKQLPIGAEYIPNDTLLNNEEQQIIILTGPNMSGKSAILRQTALCVLMAQMGCFVPASHAQIGLIDKIYTRVGASDNISQGESTFMVEMVETASILNNISERSLIILDEIGRGTSTFDGVSLAWSIAEYLSNHPFHPKTLFATHYHELNELEERNVGIKNYHITTQETKKNVIFLRKMKRGGSDRSFGIHVAQMAGIPKSILKRAEHILNQLEKDRSSIDNSKKLKNIPSAVQLSLFEISDPEMKEVMHLLEQIDVNRLTPVEALLKINELKSVLK